MVDGTTDKSYVEIVSIVCRYIIEVHDGIEVVEHVARMVPSTDRSAKGLLGLVSNSLDDVGISLEGLVSQCYDGASVMSGEQGGFQALLNIHCGRFVVYVHCFCHRLHLSVECIFDNIQVVSNYFTSISSLYTFFKKIHIRALYHGETLKRLLTTRWSGHREAVARLKGNYKEVIEALNTARLTGTKKIDSTDVALATGLLTMMTDDEWIVLTYFLNEILELVDIGNKILQSRGSQNITSAVQTINSVKDEVKKLPMKYQKEEDIQREVETSMKVDLQGDEHQSKKRKKSVPKAMIQDFFVTEHLPSASANETTQFRPVLVEMVDSLSSELEGRFKENNTSLWSSMLALLPSCDSFLDVESLKPLFQYSMTVPVIARKLEGKTIDNLRAECQVFRPVLQSSEWTVDPSTKSININEVAGYMIKNYAGAATVLTQLYKLSITAGYTSVTNECSFSALQQIDSPRRRSMSPYRECDLTFLYFERELLDSVTFEEFIQEWYKKPRRL